MLLPLTLVFAKEPLFVFTKCSSSAFKIQSVSPAMFSVEASGEDREDND